MQIQKIKINDTAVREEDSTPVVSLNIDVDVLCNVNLEEYKVSGQLDTTTLKDAVLKFINEKMRSDNLNSQP